MSDVNANIGIHFDTTDALAQLRQLQAGLSKFNQALTEGNVAAANAQKGLNAQLIQSINATGKFVASQKNIASSTTAFTDALEKNKLSMGQYFRFTAAAATQNSKIFSGAFKQERDILNRAMKDRVKSLQTQYIQLTNANGDLVKVLQVVPKHLKMVNGQYADYATRTQMAAQRQQFLNQLIKQGSTQLLNFGKNTQWAGRQLMVGLTIPLTMLGSVASKAFREMEQATVKFTRVYGDMVTSLGDTDKAVKEIQMLAKEFTKFGIAAVDTMNMAADAAAMGLTGAALQAQVTNATKLAVLGQVSQQQALETTISLQNAFGISSEDLAKKINFLNAVENQTVLSIEDLTIAIPKAAPVIKQLGGSVEDLAFFMTAMKEGGINASEGANALKSGLASMINPSKKASEFLASLGINIKGIVDANAGDIKGTVVGFARALDQLAPLDRSRAIEQMFGKFQFARISTLFQNITKDTSQAARAFGLAGASVEELAILSERELGKVENAVGVKFQKQLENLKLQLIPIGKAFLQAVTPVVEFAGKILEKFNNLSDGTKKFVVGFVAILGGIAPVALMTVGLVANGVANLIKFFGMLRGGMAKLNGQNNVLGGGFDYLTQQEIENLAQSNALHTSHQELISTFNVEKASVDLLAQAYQNAASQARALASSAPGLFNATPGPKGAVSGLPKFADGKVPGNESEGDSVLALVAPGETIVPTDKSKKYGPLLNAIMGDKLPGFAKGKYSQYASQADREYALSQSGGHGPTADNIENELGRIQHLSKTQLIKYIEATGGTVTEELADDLDKMRDIVRAGFKDIIDESKAIFGDAKEEHISAIGKKFDPDLKSWEGGKWVKGSTRMGQWAPKFNQPYRDEYSHVGQTHKYEDSKVRLSENAAKQVKDIKDFYASKGKEMPDLRFADAHGFTGSGYINNALSSEGKARAYEEEQGKGSMGRDFAADFAEHGVEKWREMTAIVEKKTKISFDSVIDQAKIYDDSLKQKLDAWNQEQEQKIANGIEPELMTDDVFAKLESEVRSDISSLIPEFNQVIEAAKREITAIRMSAGDDLEELNAYLSERGWGDKSPLGNDPNNSKVLNSEVRAKKGKRTGKDFGTMPAEASTGPKALDDNLTEMERIAETASPSRRTRRLGKDIADGLALGLGDGQPGVKSQSDNLIGSAVPTAAETQSKVDKMDLTNKAFYDDINTPEMRDQRQILKSLDRRRRKMGATREVDAAVTEPAPKSQTDLVIISSSKRTADAAEQLAVKTEEAVEAQTQVVQQIKDESKNRTTIKGNTINIGKAREDADKAENEAAITRARASALEKEQAKQKRENSPTTITDEQVKEAKEKANEAELRYAEARQKWAEAEIANAEQNGTALPEAVKRDQELISNGTQEQGDLLRKTVAGSEDVADSTVMVADQTGDLADATEEAVITQTENNESLLTASELADATATSLGDVVQATDQTGLAQQDIVDSTEEISDLNDQIEEQKRKEVARLKKMNAEALAADAIPPGSQTQKGYINPAKAMGSVEAYEEASTYTRDKNGQILFDPETGEPTTLTAKQLKQKKRGMRREKVGRYSGKISGSLGSAAMIAGMAGAPPQVTAALGGAATVAQFAPMIAGLSGPQGVVAGLIALAISAKLLNDHFRRQAVEQARLVKEISATTDKMKKIGEATGKVGASEIMAKRRQGGLYNQYNVVNRAGTKFGDTFLQSEAGKEMSKSFVKNMEQTGAPQAAKNLALQLGTYISDGVLSAEQANSIAEQIGVNLGSDTITANIQGNLRMLVGPNGEDLLNNPLKVRLDIIKETSKRSDRALENMNKAAGERNSGIAGFFGNKTGRAEAAQLAAYNVNAVEIAQAQADAIADMYDKQKKALETEIAATTNKKKQLQLQQKLSDLISQSNTDNARMQREVGNQVNRALSDFRKVQTKFQGSILNWGDTDRRAARESAYFDSLKGQVKDVYANTDYKTMANTVLSRTAKISDNSEYEKQGFTDKKVAQQLEVRVDLLMANRQINPQQATTMLDLFDGNLDQLNTVLDIGVKTHGGANTAQLIDYLSIGKNKTLMQNIVTTVTKRAPADFDKFNKALASMAVLDGHEINMQVAVDTLGQAGLDKLANDLDAIDKIKSPITKEVISKFIEDNPNMTGMNQSGMDALMSKWKEWDKLPDAAKKEAISKYQTIYETMFVDEPARIKFMEDYAKKKANEASGNGRNIQVYDFVYRSTYVGLEAGGKEGIAQAAAAEGAYTYVGEKGNIYSANGDGNGLGGKDRDTTYDELMKRLRNVRLSALNAAGGFKELQKAIAATGDKAIKDQFKGLEQQLIGMGQTQQFADYLASLDQKELNKFGYTATAKDVKKKKGKQKYTTVDPETGEKVTRYQEFKKGDFVLNQKGRDMEAGYNKAIIGDYNKAQFQSLTLAKQEIAARGQLLALGFDERDIKIMLADENYKTLIATGKVTKAELETNAVLTKQQRIRNQINGVVAGFKDKQQIADDQKRIPEVVKMMQDAGMNAEGIRQAISDPEILSTLINGMDNFATLAKDAQDEFNHLLYQIDGIPERKMIEIVYTQSVEEKTINGANAAAEMFDAYKMIDENTVKNKEGNTFAGLQVKIEDLNNQAKIAQNAINLTQSKIDDLQKDVDKDQRAIETNFTRPIDAKQRAIEKLNRSAEINFTRPIQALQERTSILSHDLEVMNHAAEEINKKYDKQQQALQEVAKVNQQIIEQQTQQLGLADALSKGDISAAAQAVQDMRATNASNYAQNSQEALQKARENEIGGLRGGVSGKTQEEIQQEQWAISQQVYALEQQKAAVDKQILIIQDEIYALEQARQVALDAIQVKTDAIAALTYGTLLDQQNALKAITDQILPLQSQSDLLAKIISDNDKNRIISGKTREEWELTKKAAEAAQKLAAGDLALALAAAEDVSGKIKGSWDSIRDAYDAIKSKKIEILQYIKTIQGPMPTTEPETNTNTTTNAVQTGNGPDAKADAALAAKYAQIAKDTANDDQVAKRAAAAAREAAAAKAQAAWQVIADRKAKYGYLSSGGIVPKYFASGGFALGTDTVPAMLTPGEFVMSRYAVNSHGVDTMKAMNSGAKTSVGDSVYNYNLSVNVKSDSNPDEIARTVMTQIRQIESQRIRGNRL